MTGGQRKLHNEELLILYSSPSIITIMNSKRLLWERHLARMGRRIKYIEYCWKGRKIRDLKRHIDISGEIRLKCIS
jgi:hypothetical protein